MTTASLPRTRAPKGSQPRQSVDSPGKVLRYAPQGATLAQFHRRRYQTLVRGLIGPLGSGKTFACISETLMMCHEQTPDKDLVRRSRWCIARNTSPDLRATTIPDVRLIVDKLNPDGWNLEAPVTWRHRYPRADGTTVDIELMFRAFDGAQDVKKARGMQLSGTWVDEAGEFPKANMDMLIGRVGRYPPRAEVPKAKFGVLFSSNAVPRDHWLAEATFAPGQGGWWIGVQPGGVKREGKRWVPNPRAENLKNLPPGYYVNQLANKKESWIRQNLANEFVVHSDGRPVHPDFSETLHTADLVPTPGLPLHLGFDWGRTPAGAVMQRQSDGNWYILREMCAKNMGADRFGVLFKKMLNAEYNGYKIEDATGDPSGSTMAQTRDETPFDLMEEAGIEVLPAHTNDPEIRFATLDRLLRQVNGGQPAILIDRSCTTLISGLAGQYQFRRLQVAGEERFEDKPLKNAASHVCEAVHYGLMGAGESDALFDQGSDDMYTDKDIQDLTSEMYHYYE